MDNWNWLFLAAALVVTGRASAAESVKPIPRQAQVMVETRRRQNAQLKAMHARHRAAVSKVRAERGLSLDDRKARIARMEADFKAARRAAREKFKAERMALRQAGRLTRSRESEPALPR